MRGPVARLSGQARVQVGCRVDSGVLLSGAAEALGTPGVIPLWAVSVTPREPVARGATVSQAGGDGVPGGARGSLNTISCRSGVREGGEASAAQS